MKKAFNLKESSYYVELKRGWKSLNTLAVISFVVLWFLLTFLAIWMPDAVGWDIPALLALILLASLFVALGSLTSPRSLLVGDIGLEVKIARRKVILYWEDIALVQANRYQLFIFSSKLPFLSGIAGILHLGFGRHVVVTWAYSNYRALNDTLQQKLGIRYKTS